MVRDFEIAVSDGWVLALLCAVGIYLAFLVYRSGLQRVSRWLLAVRVGALVLLIGLLMAPVLEVTLQTQRLPLVVLLIDDSESMRISDGDTVRSEVAQRVLDSSAFETLSARARVARFRFSDVLTEMGESESLSWSGRATDVAGALDGVREQAVGEGLAAVVLISDGGQNLGERPTRAAADLGVPVFSVGVGDPVAPVDVAIVSAIVDPLGYVGRTLEMQVRVVSSGFDRVRDQIRVLVDGQEVAAKTIILSDGEQTVQFELRPEHSGRHAFSVEIAPQASERTAVNNRVVVSTQVLKSRVRITMLAGSPSADLSYLRRVIEADSNLELDLLVRVQPAGWSREVQRVTRTLSERDLVVLLNVPYKEIAGTSEQALVGFVKQGGGLLVIGGDAAFDGDYALSALADVLPLQFLRSGHTFAEGAFPLVFARHPILRVSDDPLSDRDAWDALPPLLAYNQVGGAVPDATVLAHHPTERVNGKPMPVLAVRRVEAGKAMAVGFRTFWRYGSMMWGDGKTDDVSRAFWKNTVRWLVTRDGVSRLRVTPEKLVYRSGEPVVAHAQVFDRLLQPRTGARVYAQVADSLGGREIVMRDLGDGRYSGQLGGFPQGDYALNVRAEDDAGDLGTGVAHFTVGRYSLEYETVRMRSELLSDVAARSGGHYVRPDGLAEVLDSLVLSPEPVVNHHRARLWGQEWPLFLLVGLLVIEWAVRRRMGMI